ncbi:MAG: hypothetical protein JXC31_04300 [Acholeplasmataceae bacterium]|nr:hypothetical protein [Acholeplasmataceae bacterium]
MKKLLLGITILFMGLALTGCFASDELSAFEKTTGNIITTVNRFETIENDELNVQLLNQLESSKVKTLNLTLDTSDEMTDHEKIEHIIQLYQSVSSAHQQNTTLRLEIKDLWTTTQEQVSQFRAAELTLSDADKTTITDYKVILAVKGLEVKDTIGDVQTLIQEVKDNFNLEHLDLITANLEQVLDILTLRYEFMVYLQTVITDVNQSILSYIT